jgi:protein SCO1
VQSLMEAFARIFCISTSLLVCAAVLRGAPSYSVDGLVIAVNSPAFTVAHRPIPKLMQAMTMDFRAASAEELQPVRPGMRVRFEWRDNVARRIQIVPPDEADMPPPTRQPVPGDSAPEFALTDQLNRAVTMSSLRGKLVALNFLYTRCPMPEVCPRLAASFATVQKRFSAAMGRDLVLLSITIDPEWDTPQVMAAYAKLWRAQPDAWRFLTGPPEAVRKAATDWGLVYWPEDGAITHTSRTALIGRDGRLLAMVEGSSYRTDQLIELIRRHLEDTK